TAYADRLLDDLELLDWTEKVKSMQRNWIGRSRGAEVTFDAQGHDIKVFTTRPDTLFGAEYMVLATEHELVKELASTEDYGTDINTKWTYGKTNPQEAIASYLKDIASETGLERQENQEKTGVFIGADDPNPVNRKQIPMLIGDYVLMGYVTGAIMAVPAHDTRDYEFATEFELPITEVVAGGDITQEAYTGEGTVVNSANDDGLDINGLSKQDAIVRTIEWLEDKGLGV